MEQVKRQKDMTVEELETALERLSQKRYNRNVEELTDKEAYVCLLELTKEAMATTEPIKGAKKVYYISAEFLIGKLLSNNLINLGIYDKVAEVLKVKGKELAKMEEIEPEPSLG